MPWQSPCWLSQDVSPFYGKLQKGFGCVAMRSGHLLGFAEKPFPPQGNGTHTRPSCSAKSQCKPLLPPSPVKQSHSWQRTGGADMSFAKPLRVLCCWGAEPSAVGRVPGRPLPPGRAASGCTPAPALQAGSNPACHSPVSWERRRSFLACTFLLCSSTEPGLKAIVVFAPYGGNK